MDFSKTEPGYKKHPWRVSTSTNWQTLRTVSTNFGSTISATSTSKEPNLFSKTTINSKWNTLWMFCSVFWKPDSDYCIPWWSSSLRNCIRNCRVFKIRLKVSVWLNILLTMKNGFVRILCKISKIFRQLSRKLGVCVQVWICQIVWNHKCSLSRRIMGSNCRILYWKDFLNLLK
jgi:hypothetical protein